MESNPANCEVCIDTATLPERKRKFPREDFIDSQFDVDRNVKTTDILIIFSTPRSGSTFLCEYLYQNDICIAHEYFQKPDYLPLMANRWACIANGKLDKQSYVNKLLKYRTLANGWLGINLHGSHIQDYLKLEKHFAGINKHYLYLRRRDIVAQAVSFELAAQSKQWTTHFSAKHDVSYSSSGIADKLERINSGDLAIQAFIKAARVKCPIVYYEDLVRSPQKALSIAPCINPRQLRAPVTTVTRQATTRNEVWIKKFSSENPDKVYTPKPKQESVLKRLLARLLPP